MPPKKSSQQSSDGASGTSLNLPFISSEIGKLTKLDITSCSPEGFEIWKQRWDSVTTITGFYTLSNETQKALFINVLSDDTIKRMNNLGQQDVQTLIQSFQRQVCGSSNMFVHEYEFHKRVQGSNESFDEFYNDLQTLLNKCQYKDCCQSTTQMSCKDRILLARLVAGIKSHDIRKGLLCVQDLTLDKAVQYIQVDEATSSQADKFLTKVNKTGASTYRQNKFPRNTGKGDQPPPTKDGNLRKCKFCMKFHVFKKEFCPAKDSVCRDCQNKGHWAKSVMCPKFSKPTGASVDPDKKVTDDSPKPGVSTKPTLKVISADHELPVTSDVSVKAITIPSVGKHYYADFILGNHNWKQKCMVDPGSNINCVGYDWITHFDTPEWSYNLECGSVKTAGGHNLDVEARVLLKISWPPENPTISADQWFYIVHGEDGIILGTPACQALGVIDDDWPISTMLQNLNHPSSVNTLDTPEIKPLMYDNDLTKVDQPVLSPPASDDDLLSDLNWQRTPRPSESAVKVTSVNANAQTMIYTEDTNFTPLLQSYNDVFDDTSLPEMKGDAFKINLKPDAQPYAQAKARKIPIPYMDQLKKQLDEMERLGVISAHEEPSTWCHPIVIAPKKDSDELRICIDFTHLNKFIQREFHPSNSPFEAVTSIPAEELKYFCKFDARHGYWQIPLHPESSPLTCFITPFGRYVCNRAAFGISSISEWYNRRMDKVVNGLHGIRKIVDDVLVYAPTLSALKKRVHDFLDRCSTHGVTLKRSKSQIAVREADFGGFHLSETGIQCSFDLLKSIRDFPRPKNLTDLRSWFGLVNQLGNFSQEITQIMEPFRPLLQKNSCYLWLPEHEQAFNEAKRRLSSPPVLTYFAVNRPTLLATDASRLHGLGFVLLQMVDGIWKPVQAGSRFLTPTESRYAMIELEALGACWAMKKCDMFLQGLPHFKLVTDHQPLIPILNSKGIADVDNPRLQRLMMKMLPYTFTAEWVKGKQHLAADALSRFPVDEPCLEDELCELHAEAAVNVHFVDKSTTTCHLNELFHHQQADDTLLKVIHYVQTGWPEVRNEVNEEARPFWSVRHNLYMASVGENFILLMNGRTVIPAQQQKKTLSNLHEGHQGIEKTRRRARDSVYWPGMNQDIEEMVKRCSECRTLLPVNTKEPLQQLLLPTRPWDKLGLDLYSLNHREYLIVTDYFSSFTEVYDLGKDATAPALIKELTQLFSRFGQPVEVISDGGSQFTCKAFATFVENWNFIHTVSSPTHAQSNGKAEAAVKNVKKLLKKCGSMNDQFWKGLLAIRNTPLLSGKSPAELLLGRTLHDSLPRYPGPATLDNETKEKILDLKKKEKNTYDQHATLLPPLQPGTRVAIRSRVDSNWSLLGTVTEIRPNRTYAVLTDQGSTLTRNRRYLRPAPPPSHKSPATDEQNLTSTANPMGGRHVGLRDPYNLRKRCTKN